MTIYHHKHTDRDIGHRVATPPLHGYAPLAPTSQSTSSILDPSSLSSSSGGRSSTSSGSSSSSMERPSLIMRWMRPAKVAGSSSEKPEVRSDVSKRRCTRSLTVLSPLSAAALALSSFMIECFGLISMVFFEAMYEDIELSRSAWARMMRSMLAVQPYSPVTRTHGDSVTRSLMTTFSTLSPRISFMSLESGSKSAQSSSHAFLSSSDSSNLRPSLVTETSFLPSYSLSCCTQYSSIGSTMKSTS